MTLIPTPPFPLKVAADRSLDTARLAHFRRYWCVSTRAVERYVENSRTKPISTLASHQSQRHSFVDHCPRINIAGWRTGNSFLLLTLLRLTTRQSFLAREQRHEEVRRWRGKMMQEGVIRCTVGVEDSLPLMQAHSGISSNDGNKICVCMSWDISKGRVMIVSRVKEEWEDG